MCARFRECEKTPGDGPCSVHPLNQPPVRKTAAELLAAGVDVRSSLAVYPDASPWFANDEESGRV